MTSNYALDQAVEIGQGLLRQANDEVDKVVEKALLEGSPDSAIDYGYSLVRTGQMRGVQLARLLYSLAEVWTTFDTDDTIEDSVFKGMGISERKFRDYTELYRYVLRDHPELSGKPIGGLLAITVAAREGEFSDNDWTDLGRAHDKSAMLDIRTRARGVHTKGHKRLSGQVDRDGHVWAYEGGGEPDHAGVLNIGAKDGTPAAKLVQRIIEAAGLARR